MQMFTRHIGAYGYLLVVQYSIYLHESCSVKCSQYNIIIIIALASGVKNNSIIHDSKFFRIPK